MTNSTDVSYAKMTRFGYRVDLIRERHVRVKDEAKIAMSLLRYKFVRSENLRRCCFVPIRRNSVLDGLRSSLFKFKFHVQVLNMENRLFLNRKLYLNAKSTKPYPPVFEHFSLTNHILGRFACSRNIHPHPHSVPAHKVPFTHSPQP